MVALSSALILTQTLGSKTPLAASRVAAPRKSGNTHAEQDRSAGGADFQEIAAINVIVGCVICHLRRCAGSAMNRTANALIGAASADVAVHGGIDFCIRGLRCLRQQCGRGHDLSGLTVAALGNLFGNPGRLQRVIRCRRQTLDGRHLLCADTRYGVTAGSDGRAIQMHGARSALLQAASEFCSGQADGVTNDPEQRRVRCHIHVVLLAIDGERNHERSSKCKSIAIDNVRGIGKSENSKLNDSCNFKSEI